MSEPLPVTAPAAPAAVPAAAAGLMARRFRGYLPVAIDVECGGFHAATDALLEIAAVQIDMDADGTLRRGATHNYHVQPFAGARLDPAALSITGIDPWHPLRPALPERDALQRVFREIRHVLRAYQCRRAQRGPVLPGVQPPARQLRGGRGACAGIRLAGRRRRAGRRRASRRRDAGS